MHSDFPKNADRDKQSNIDAYIKVSSLSRHFGPNIGVDDISFEVKQGEILGFLGPNGAGKSTTMQLLTGNLAPTQGQITVMGMDLLDQPRQVKACIGYLPEQPPLYREFTVLEYLRFCARLHKIAKSQLENTVQKTLQQLELDQVQHRLIGNLSKGFQQRVGIAQAIVHTPPVIILDEPTVGLDPNQIRHVRELIKELGKDHCVILSTHILSEVQSVCDRVQIINKGKIILQEHVNRLEDHLHSRSLTIGFASRRHISDFSDINDVDTVERLDDTRFRICHQPHRSPAQTIVNLSVEKNWQLIELTPDKQSLEQVFVALTDSEQAKQNQEQAP